MYKSIGRNISRLKFRGDWVFSRTACLGNDAYRGSQSGEIKRWNIQKGRMDILVRQLKGISRETTPPPRVLFSQEENWKISCQVSSNYWNHFQPPKFILIDSFSELTDQMFVYKGIEFLSHYNDLNWMQQESKDIESLGLLPLDKIHDHYLEFVQATQSRWGDIPCYFINFPSKFDQREELKIRAELISDAIGNIEKKHRRVKVITIPNDEVQLNDAELAKEIPFPYHFAQSTLNFVSEQIDEYEHRN